MARDKNEHYSVVRSGRIDVSGPGITAERELNFDQLLSKTNRRLYRQGRCYDVKLDIDVSSTQTYNIFALSNSWMNERAFQLAYEMYLENSEDERDRLKKSNLARWQDFRVVSGLNYQQVDPVQYSQTLSPSVMVAGSFELTLVGDALGVYKNFSWGAPTSSRYSMLEEYDKAGNAQSTPSTTTGDMPYDNLMADDDAVVAESLQLRGAQPPYDATGVSAGSPWVKVATLEAGTSQRLSTGFFKAPCGIVIITAGASENVDVSKFEWTAKAGDYKGIHAPSLLEE